MRFPGSFSMIISHMPKQCSPLVIYFVTYTARQRNFWHVCCKVRLCLKTFLTVQTFYGLLCIMNSPHVCMKVRILTKFLATNFTGLRFFSSVHSFKYFKCCWGTERLFANITLVWFYLDTWIELHCVYFCDSLMYQLWGIVFHKYCIQDFCHNWFLSGVLNNRLCYSNPANCWQC